MSGAARAGLVLAALLAPALLPAQGWVVEAGAGRALHDPVSARVSTTTASMGASYQGAARWLYLNAGLPLSGGGAGWGAAGAGTWLGVTRGRFPAGIAAGGHAFGYGAAGPNPSGGGATLELIPTVFSTVGQVTVQAGSGFVGVVDVLGDSTDARPYLQSHARAGYAAAQGVDVGAEARHLLGAEGAWPYLGASAELRQAWGGAWAYAGRWLDGIPSPATAYGVGVRVGVVRGTEVQASLRQEPVDPLYFGTPRRTWGVQVTRAIGRRAAHPPAGLLPEIVPGEAVFRLPRRDYPEAPAVLGDFNDWQPVPMQAEGEHWVARLRVAPGVHHYAFRLADGTVHVPAGIASVDDGFGGRSAVLVMP
ncbi:MAG TPA: glycogen-binding domain-containing protein [Longimicrobium sp.]|nr:glycogen-binding domain-containing protein [Longimicrobium sp.]